MMKKISLLLYIFLFILFPCRATSLKTDSAILLKQKITELNDQMIRTRNDIEYTKSLVQVSNGTISNQLSSSQHTLSTLSILFTIIGIMLAIAIPLVSWYITRLANRVNENLAEANQILATITRLRTEVSTIETEVNNTKDLIQNNLSGLYQSLQSEEVAAMFKQLKNEPSDIRHFFPKLATIKMPDNYFNNLKEVYFETLDIDITKAGNAIALIAQHYPKECFNDPQILSELKKFCVSAGFYITEYPAYFNELCNFIRNKDINNYIYLFSNSIEGIEMRSNPQIYADSMLKIWNDSLSDEHKQVIIDLINSSTLFLNFKANVKNWNDLLKIS